MNLALFVCEDVGLEIAKYFKQLNFPVKALIVSDNEDANIKDALLGLKVASITMTHSELNTQKGLATFKQLQIDLSILAWWHYIIKEPLINFSKYGYLNFHPSLLPYNRGKHYYFWNLVENVPFGVTLHIIDTEIDKGTIVFQKAIITSWLDNGNSLRERSKQAIIELFKENFDDIVNANFSPRAVDWENGTQHWGHELDKASKIDLDNTYSGRELLNIIRGRSGFEHGGAWFEDDGIQYEVSISINKINKEI